MGRVREEKRRRKKIKNQKRESLRRKKIQVREKVGKSRNTVFPMVRGSRGSKSRLAKAAGAEPGGQIRDEKLHAIVAQSTCPSQNVQFRARFEVEMSKKWTPLWREAHFEVKMHNVEVEMSKKCTPLWREAHFEVKMHKTHPVRSTFGS